MLELRVLIASEHAGVGWAYASPATESAGEGGAGKGSEIGLMRTRLSFSALKSPGRGVLSSAAATTGFHLR